MIDVYNDGHPQEMKYLVRAIPARIRMEGFIYTDQFIDCMEELHADMGGLIASGAVTMRETVHDGLESAPDAFLGLFSGANMGKIDGKSGVWGESGSVSVELGGGRIRKKK